MSIEIPELTVAATAIPGLLMIDLPLHEDQRGWFKENWQRAKMVAAGLPDFHPVQNNISFNRQAGTTRGFHAEPWDKYVSVATGSIFAAWVDLRAGESFGQSVWMQLGPDRAVFVPRGVANAFQTLEENTAYTYLVTEHWSASSRDHYSYVNLADSELAVPWPIPLENATVSEADLHHPNLADAAPVAEKKILVLGGGGQLGRALGQRHAEDPRLEVHRRDELDLCSAEALDQIDWSAYSHVINAAAYTSVDAAETPSCRQRAWQVNATAVQALSARCIEHGLVLIHVSTDYVFDGMQKVYTEEATIAPLGVYGQSKAAGETAVRSVPQHYLVRTSWVIGNGTNFVDTMARLARSDISPMVVDDQIGRLTFAEDLAAGIMHLIDHHCAFGTYNLQGNGAPLSWYSIAKQVFSLCGQDPQRVSSTTTEEYSSTKSPFAPRPRFGVLDTTKLRATGFCPQDQLVALHNYLSQQH
ncbi:sugar nucleotide-binding protein [Glutamicibacter arilaitensis]|uniref:sugar nucleotide-binding protein n=1 Tax=Glutamicibacter arilaitensis TaxID=256701 RepID=UPI003FCF9119